MTQTNFRDVEQVISTKGSIYQTLRFILANSFTQIEPEPTKEITAIHVQCPSLLNDLLPYSETDEDAPDENAPQSTTSAEADNAHQKTTAIGCLERSHVVNVLRLPMWPGYLDSNDPFSLLLQAAYHIDYYEPNGMLPRKETGTR